MTVHYGPVWFYENGTRKPPGVSLALCLVGGLMSASLPEVTCPACQKAFALKLANELADYEMMRSRAMDGAPE